MLCHYQGYEDMMMTWDLRQLKNNMHSGDFAKVLVRSVSTEGDIDKIRHLH